MKITPRQLSALKRLVKNGRELGSAREHFTPELAKQLDRKGLATLTGHKWQRSEWNRKVVGATLWEVRLAAAGLQALNTATAAVA